jgi:hypothetical protein
VDVEEFTLLFKSAREFFFAPIVEYGPLGRWKEVAGRGQELQDVFWYIKQAIDAYFGNRAFQITVQAGCLSGEKRVSEEQATAPVELLDPAELVEPLNTSDVELVEVDDIELDAFKEDEPPPEDH